MQEAKTKHTFNTLLRVPTKTLSIKGAAEELLPQLLGVTRAMASSYGKGDITDDSRAYVYFLVTDREDFIKTLNGAFADEPAAEKEAE